MIYEYVSNRPVCHLSCSRGCGPTWQSDSRGAMQSYRAASPWHIRVFCRKPGRSEFGQRAISVGFACLLRHLIGTLAVLARAPN
jgi:hypothetical protein